MYKTQLSNESFLGNLPKIGILFSTLYGRTTSIWPDAQLLVKKIATNIPFVWLNCVNHS